MRYYCRIRTILPLTIFSFSFVAKTHAVEIGASENNCTVVFLSLQETDPEAAWPASEERIQDELSISGISFIVLPGNLPENVDIERRFLEIADTYKAKMVIMIEKTGENDAALIMLAGDTATASKKFQNIPIDIDVHFSDEATDEFVAMKSIEVVRIELRLISEQKNAGPKIVVEKSKAPKWKIVLARTGLSAGVLTLTVGGALHGMAYYHANEANMLASWSTTKERWETGYDKKYQDYVRHDHLSKNFKIGMITTYAVGGLLTVTSVIFLVSIKGKERSKMALVPTGCGVKVYF